MLKKLSSITLGIILSIVSYAPKILAHGSKIVYKQTEAMQIIAKYDNGEPMSKAQVVIYTPKNLTQPWLTGIADNEGKFIFTPDFSITGNWSVKVRVAGHGAIINIPIESSSPQPDSNKTNLETKETETTVTQLKISSQTDNQQQTMLQKIVMAVTGVWGFVGTALFFSRKKV